MAGAGELQFRFAVLGPLTVSSDGAEVEVGGDLRRGLLVRLLMAANRPVEAGQLAEDLWNGRPPPGAASTLQSHISALRRIVGAARLVNRHGSYRLAVGADELDVARFEDLARRGNQAMSASPADPTRAAEALGAALECWRGAALADVADASWARGDITRLEELRAATLESWLQARLGLGDHVGVVGAAENALAADPLRERLWAQLMVALYRSGRQAEALRAYQRLRARLGEELGIEPTSELRALEDAILLQKPELDWQSATRPDSITITGAAMKGPEADAGLVEHAGLVGDLEAAVAAGPLQERGWAQLMLALYRSDRQADALRAFERLRKVLADALGVEPSDGVKALEAAIRARDPALTMVSPSVQIPDPTRDRLPSGTVTFLFTDVEGSTRLFRLLGERYQVVLDEHRRMVRASRLVQRRGGGANRRRRDLRRVR